MKSKSGPSRTGAIVISIVLGAVLAGCAPAVNPAHSPTIHPRSTVEPQTATPLPLLGGDCSRLIPIAAVKSATDTATVSLVAAPALNDLYLLPIRQAGGIDCEWRDAGIAVDLDVSVLPNATSALEAQTARLDASDDGKDAAHVPNVPTYGDQSWTQCYSLGDDPSDGCTFDIRIGTFWVEVNQVYGGPFTAYPQAPAVHSLLSNVVETVRSLAPVRPWKPDVKGLSLPTSCSATLPLATVRSATGVTDLTQNAGTATFSTLLDGAFASTGSLYCQWFSQRAGVPIAGFTLTMVPGSTWAWSATAGPPARVAPYPLPSQAGLGSAAFGGCQTSEYSSECDLFVLANHTWFELKQDNQPTRPAALSSLISLARSYLTTIGFTA